MTRQLTVLGLFVVAGAATAGDLFSSSVTGPASVPFGGGTTLSNEYNRDDGGMENAIGLTAAGNVAFFNRYTVTAGNQLLTQIRIAFGTHNAAPVPPLVGAPIFVGVWAAPTTTSVGALLSGQAATILNEQAATPAPAPLFSTYNIADVNLGAVGTTFWVGFIMNGQAAGQFPGGIDQTASSLNSFIGIGAAAINTGNPGPSMGTFGEIGALGGAALAGNWFIRADAQAVPTPGAVSLLGLAGIAGLRRRR